MSRWLTVTALVLGCTSLWAQSLGEAATREKKRREAQERKDPPKTITDEDLKKYGPVEGSSRTPESRSVSPAPADSTVRNPSSTELADERKRTVAEGIRGRVLACQDDVAAARDTVKQLESQLERAPYQTDVYWRTETIRQRLERLIKEAQVRVDGTRRRCDEIEDEARKQSIPPGWIR